MGLTQEMLDTAPQPALWPRAGTWLLIHKITAPPRAALRQQLGAEFSNDSCNTNFHETPWATSIPMRTGLRSSRPRSSSRFATQICLGEKGQVLALLSHPTVAVTSTAICPGCGAALTREGGDGLELQRKCQAEREGILFRIIKKKPLQNN